LECFLGIYLVFFHESETGAQQIEKNLESTLLLPRLQEANDLYAELFFLESALINIAEISNVTNSRTSSYIVIQTTTCTI
jgi:hypothetical protein